jgi:hypothetical protein
MVRVIFDGSTLGLADIGHGQNEQKGAGLVSHFQPQVQYQRGWGHGQFPHYGRQRGAGVGAVLKNIWRFLKPMASSFAPIASGVARELGKEGLAATARTLEDVSKGQELGKALGLQAKESARHLLDKAQTKLNQRGSGQRLAVGQVGKGRAKRAYKGASRNTRQKSGVILKPEYTVPGRALIKKRRLDSLGYY